MATTLDPVADTATDEDRIFLLDGRKFRRARRTTIDQDAYTIKRFKDAGMLKIFNEFDPEKEKRISLIERLIYQAFECGVMYEILAGTLNEEGVTWSRHVAAYNAKAFAALETREEKDTIFANVADVIIDFLRIAAGSLSTFQKLYE